MLTVLIFMSKFKTSHAPRFLTTHTQLNSNQFMKLKLVSSVLWAPIQGRLKLALESYVLMANFQQTSITMLQSQKKGER